MTTTNTAIAQSTKLVVLQNGQRVSKQIHESMVAAEAERDAHVKRLQENKNTAAVPTVTISNLLLG